MRFVDNISSLFFDVKPFWVLSHIKCLGKNRNTDIIITRWIMESTIEQLDSLFKGGFVNGILTILFYIHLHEC